MSTLRVPLALPTPSESCDGVQAGLQVCVRGKSTDLTVLSVSVVPNAKRTEVVGLHGGDLRIRLAAPPVDGKANDSLTAWVAEQLHLPKRAVRLLRGTSSRQKQLEIDLAAVAVMQWLEQRLALARSHSEDAGKAGA